MRGTSPSAGIKPGAEDRGRRKGSARGADSHGYTK